jgi:RNA polymerase sigma-70 factor, ECF subfamily
LTNQTNARRFEAVILPHLNAAYNLARWLTRNNHDAEDIVQEACLRALKFFDSFRGDNGRAWLLGIVRNTSYTWLEKHRKHELNTPFDEEFHSLDADCDDRPDTNPESLLARAQDSRLLNQALEQLPVEFREMLVLRELEDLSYKEIADVAAVPIGTVMSRLARGRKLLMKHLRQTVEGAGDGM